MGQSEGYESDVSAISEHTYGYNADDNDDTSVIEATNLVAHAARRQPPAGILKKKDLPKKTDLPVADPQRLMSNRSTPLIGKDGKVTGHLTSTANMAVLNHRFDQLNSLQPISIKDNHAVSVHAT